MNVWAGMVHDYLIGPYIFPIRRLNGRTYSILLQETLPELLTEVPASIRGRIWFQHHGAPANFSPYVRNYLDATYANRWIGQCGSVRCPP
ncbi:hypothetical protein AVEN_65077-1 [Araneus ventricosus]|uniref:Uncharacterized protein n=1 Tax=Araneus ventricosus TaxID=182803 RepID=A0A4Y2FAB2_ARAVE|nr:hypothetical protein AVEN_65077-1 [Araneus ventricosus]